MNDDFLHRLREEPRPAFLRDLRRKLKRIEGEVEGRPAHPMTVTVVDTDRGSRPRPFPLRSLFTGMLIGASAMALAAVALNQTFPGVHAFLESHGLASGSGDAQIARGGGEARSGAGSAAPRGGADPLRNAWTVATRNGSVGPSDLLPGAGRVPVEPLPSGSTPNGGALATPANYGVGTVGIGQGGRGYALLVATRGMGPFAVGAAQRFNDANGWQGLAPPKVLVATAKQAFAQFCSGAGLDSPDVVYADRVISRAESESCTAKWGANAVQALVFGYEAVVLARSHLSGQLNRTPRQMFLALAARVPDPMGGTVLVPNPYRTWSQIEGVGDSQRIEVTGPPLASTSGNAFLDLLMEQGCDSFGWIAALRGSDPKQHDDICRVVRRDGAYTELGNVGITAIDSRLESEPGALAVVGLRTVEGMIRGGAALDLGCVGGVTPSEASIVDGSYPASRPLYLYLNTSHLRPVKDLGAFVRGGPVALGSGGAVNQFDAVLQPAQTQRDYRQFATRFSAP
ncbi:MAG TPA: substrate-binding domain-containing protein [Steroidobacteraceae bacterium]|jgi:phosphate transport system substrate-binding protein